MSCRRIVPVSLIVWQLTHLLFRAITAQDPANDIPRNPPVWPNKYAINIEHVTASRRTVVYSKVQVDYDHKVGISDSSDHPADPKPMGAKRIYDFNTGLLYEIKKRTGVCRFLPILPEGTFSKANTSEPVEMATSSYIFGLSASDGATYNGTVKIRGVDTDLWTTDVKAFAKYGYKRAVFGYTAKNWTIGLTPSVTEVAQFWYLELTFVNNKTRDFHVSHVDEAEMELSAFDYDHCFSPDNKRFFTMALHVGDMDVQKFLTKTSIRTLREEIRGHVANMTQLRLLRVASPQIHHIKQHEYIYFSAWLLGNFPLNLDDKKYYYSNVSRAATMNETSLTDATEAIKGLKGLTINFQTNASYAVPLEIKSADFKDMTRPAATPLVAKQKLSSGAVAGAAIGCIMAGLLLGGLLTFCLVTVRTKESLSASFQTYILGKPYFGDIQQFENPSFKK